MSDVQLATRIAILISGYSQLHCGITCYQWKIVGRLAWFSSLTHLSCLTLLRKYLHNHPSERHWRLLFMFILIVMLVTAMVPTGNYDWRRSSYNPEPNDYAICSFSEKSPRNSPANLSMIALVSLISLGFAIRVIKLHELSSVSLVGRPRQRLSNVTRRLLWIIYNWREDSALLLRRIPGRIFYFPALALLLTLRVILDHWSSMFFEVFVILVFKTELDIIF